RFPGVIPLCEGCRGRQGQDGHDGDGSAEKSVHVVAPSGVAVSRSDVTTVLCVRDARLRTVPNRDSAHVLAPLPVASAVDDNRETTHDRTGWGRRQHRGAASPG